jgi:hypothetical protein
MVNVTLQFTHWDSASLQVISRRLLSPRESVHLSIGTSHFVTVQKETASRVNFMGIDRRMFRTTRLSWRAAFDSAPKKIPTQRSVATRIRETFSAVLLLNHSRLRRRPESNRELQVMM